MIFSVNVTVDLVTVTEEILNGKVAVIMKIICN